MAFIDKFRMSLASQRQMLLMALGVTSAICFDACSESGDQQSLDALVRGQLSQFHDIRLGKAVIYRVQDRKLACIDATYRNEFDEPQPEVRFTAWYVPEYKAWNTDKPQPASSRSCDDIAKDAANYVPPPIGAHVAPIPFPVTPPVKMPELARSNASNGIPPSQGMSSPTSSLPARTAADGLSSDYQTCLTSGDAASGITSAVMTCTNAEASRQDAQLNQAYKLKMAALSLDRQQALRASERDWIGVRDSGCKASAEDAGGSLGGVVYAKCVATQTAVRTRAIEAFQ